MEVKIYGDVLAAVNFTVTLLILRLCGKVLGTAPGKISRYLAAALGAAAAFIIFIPLDALWFRLLYRLLVSVLAVGVAFPCHTACAFLKSTGIFYAVSFFLAGVTAGLLWVFPTAGFYSRGGVYYFNIRPLTLLGAIAVAYGAVSLLDRFAAHRTPPENLFRITLKKGGRQVPVKALADSGNLLTEPFSGLPVIIVTATAAWPLLTEPERNVVGTVNLECAIPGVRWVLCRSVTDSCLLPVFLPDAVVVQWKGKSIPVNACFAVAQNGIGDQCDYSAVFNPKMIQVLLR